MKTCVRRSEILLIVLRRAISFRTGTKQKQSIEAHKQRNNFIMLAFGFHLRGAFAFGRLIMHEFQFDTAAASEEIPFAYCNQIC